MSLEGTISWAALFDEASARLAAVSADPRIDARRIVEQAGGIEPSQFSSMLDDLVTTRQMVAYDRMIERRFGQLATPHLASLGAREMPRRQFVKTVDRLVRLPSVPLPWVYDETLLTSLAT